MIVLEIAALLIVLLFILVRARFGREPRRFLYRLGLLVIASWIVEDTCIHAYGFYAYSPEWSLFVDRVPLAILLIWPIVIHSAWELTRNLLANARRAPVLVPLVGALFVLADASVMEPIAVASKLWWWTQPGLWAVPPIGILGWAFYAGLCMAVLERNERAQAAATADAALLLLAPLGTHVLLLASWWGLFRWINTTLTPWPFLVAAWLLATTFTLWSLRRTARERIPVLDMWTRVPAALFFFVLLALRCRHMLDLVAYALAFVSPYVSLTRWPQNKPAQRAAT